MFIHIRILLLLLIFQILYSQSSNIKFERISAEQGLSKSDVTCILQDTKGFMWFGSELGLKKFDGYKFIVFQHDPNNSGSLSNDNIRAITEDKSGSLWIGTLFGGLNRFDRKAEKFIHYEVIEDNLPKDKSIYIYSILEDQSGKLWIGTNIGLCYFDREIEAVKRYSAIQSNSVRLNNSRVHILYEDRKGNIWIGTKEDGLFMFDPETESFAHYKHNPRVDISLSNNRIESIAEDNSGNLFIGTRNGLNKFDRQNNNFTYYFYESLRKKVGEQNWIRALCPTNSDLIWIASSEGLSKIDTENDTFMNIIHESNYNDELINYSIKKLYKDRRGILWIGTYTGDIFKFDPNRIQFFRYKSDPEDPYGLSNNFIIGICEDSEGNLWVGTGGGGLYGLSASQSGLSSPKWIHYKHNSKNIQSLSNNYIRFIFEDHEQTLWIGTNSGVNKFDRPRMYLPDAKNQKKNRSSINNIPKSVQTLRNHCINCIYEDKNNDIWIGTHRGLYKFDRTTELLVYYVGDPNNSGSLGKKGVNSIIESRTGQMWIGTVFDGVYNFDPVTEIFDQYNVDPENPYSNAIFMIHEDTDNSLWIATKKGLYEFDPSTGNFSHYNNNFGLPEDDIYTILDDRAGNLWLSSVKGIFRFSPESGMVKSFDTNDGLHGMEFNARSYHKSKSGWMYLGGINGFTAFHPDSIKYNDRIPKIVLTDFQIYNKSIRLGVDSPLKKTLSESKKVTLTYDQSVFSFEFAALDYSSPQKNKYAYLMEGIDPDWVYTDASRRFATYTNLDPGEYIFHVKGSNNDGVWNEEGISVKIIITPPWWKTNLAYTFYIFLFGFIVFTAWRFQTNRLKIKHELELEHVHAEKLEEVDHIKSRFFANISHEFRTPLTLIQGPVRQILNGEFTGNLKEQCKMILRNSGRLLELINQLLDLSKLESGQIKLQVAKTDILKMIKGLVQSFSSLAGRKKIILKFDVKGKSIWGYIDRDKLEKIVNNLMSNAFKFTAEGGEVEVTLSLRGLSRSEKKELTKQSQEIDSLGQGLLHRPPAARNDDNGIIQIKVSNTGAGIPADQLDKIFNRFYQVNESGNQGHMGSGIGLALTKELVEAHYGEIFVESEMNKKTTFKVTLPIDKESFKAQEIVEKKEAEERKPDSEKQISPDDETSPLEKGDVPRSPVSLLPSPLVLIVEDSPDVSGYICSFMENDYHVLTAENGAAGIKTAFEKYPDLIISDVMMPEMDGFELCKKLKSDENTSHIPIILLTAKADMESKIDGLEFGADDYISKPFDANELQARVKNLIEQRKTLREKFSRTIDCKPADIAATSMDEQFLKRLLDVFENHVAESDFSTEEFAREIGMSRSNLHRKLQALTNQPTHEFLRSLRLKRAAQLLKKSEVSVAEVAYAVGFNNPSHFSKIFRRQFGQTPSQFANKNQ